MMRIVYCAHDLYSDNQTQTIQPPNRMQRHGDMKDQQSTAKELREAHSSVESAVSVN